MCDLIEEAPLDLPSLIKHGLQWGFIGIYEMKPEQEGSANLLVKKLAQRDVRNILHWRNEIWRVQGKPLNIRDLILKGFSWGSLKDHCIYGYPSLWWLKFSICQFCSHISYVGHDCHSIKVFKYNFSYYQT